MSILCLTGWQQPQDALAVIAPFATHFNYAAYDNAGAMFEALPHESDLAIGWSLGGQLLVRAVAGGHLKTKKLLLIGAPFQHLADEHFPEGLPLALFEEFRKSYRAQPEKTIRQFHIRIGMGDSQSRSITHALNNTIAVWENGPLWLDELGNASCRNLDFSRFPKTIIVHGVEDKIIYPYNAHAYARVIAGAELQLRPDCGHAPHLHDSEALRELIEPYV